MLLELNFPSLNYFFIDNFLILIFEKNPEKSNIENKFFRTVTFHKFFINIYEIFKKNNLISNENMKNLERYNCDLDKFGKDCFITEIKNIIADMGFKITKEFNENLMNISIKKLRFTGKNIPGTLLNLLGLNKISKNEKYKIALFRDNKESKIAIQNNLIKNICEVLSLKYPENIYINENILENFTKGLSLKQIEELKNLIVTVLPQIKDKYSNIKNFSTQFEILKITLNILKIYCLFNNFNLPMNFLDTLLNNLKFLE